MSTDGAVSSTAAAGEAPSAAVLIRSGAAVTARGRRSKETALLASATNIQECLLAVGDDGDDACRTASMLLAEVMLAAVGKQVDGVMVKALVLVELELAAVKPATSMADNDGERMVYVRTGFWECCLF